MSNKYIYWKWATGDIMKKSTRQTNEKTQKEDIPSVISDRMHVREQTTRELNSERMSQRDKIIQTSINPFMMSNNYLDDLKIQDDFLRPKDSNLKSEAE
jgi:hypothetical protein|tara:strand:+ start:548 stop:844 length:297 start_codon:yes stop_codon:yes gene_type:complete